MRDECRQGARPVPARFVPAGWLGVSGRLFKAAGTRRPAVNADQIEPVAAVSHGDSGNCPAQDLPATARHRSPA
jgi:hypothetical protein